MYCMCKVCVYVLLLLSAGVGRTGVFITLSIVLERMRYEGVVDLFQTVKTLRTQRPAMVQTEVSSRQQYWSTPPLQEESALLMSGTCVSLCPYQAQHTSTQG